MSTSRPEEKKLGADERTLVFFESLQSQLPPLNSVETEDKRAEITSRRKEMIPKCNTRLKLLCLLSWNMTSESLDVQQFYAPEAVNEFLPELKKFPPESLETASTFLLQGYIDYARETRERSVPIDDFEKQLKTIPLNELKPTDKGMELYAEFQKKRKELMKTKLSYKLIDSTKLGTETQKDTFDIAGTKVLIQKMALVDFCMYLMEAKSLDIQGRINALRDFKQKTPLALTYKGFLFGIELETEESKLTKKLEALLEQRKRLVEEAGIKMGDKGGINRS